MHPPNLCQTVIAIIGEIPNSCGICGHYADSICARFEQEVSVKQLCDDFKGVV